jgi:hypothetical protein
VDSALTAVNTDDLNRLANRFDAGAAHISATGQSLAERTRPRNAPFGSGSAAPATIEAYARARKDLVGLTDHIGSLMRRHSDAMTRAADTFDGTQARNGELIRTQA